MNSEISSGACTEAVVSHLNKARHWSWASWPLAVGLALSGCGGGSDYVPSSATGTGTTTTTTDANPMVVNTESKAVMRQGDIWMYEWVNQTAGTGYYTTHYLETLDKTSQLYTHAVLFSDDQPAQKLHFSSNNVLTLRGFENTLCRYEPQTRSIYPRSPWVVGGTWSYIWSESCLNGSVATTVNKSLAGTIVSVSETLGTGLLGQGGTAAGSVETKTFQTVKYTATRTDVTSAGTWTYSDTCWHDKAQDRTVKCDTHASYLPAGASAPTSAYDQTQRLAFVREVRSASPVLITDGTSTVAIFSGRWSFKLEDVGGVTTCPSMVISTTGNLTGNCVRVVSLTGGGTQEVPYSVSGSVQRRAVTTQEVGQAAVTRTIDSLTVVANTGANALTITGEMVTPLLAEGTWTGEGTTGGAWVAKRL